MRLLTQLIITYTNFESLCVFYLLFSHKSYWRKFKYYLLLKYDVLISKNILSKNLEF